jgi:dolichol-phosphate mannosyltransferase
MNDERAGRSLVIVPTYNESESIREVVKRLMSAVGESVHLLVIDDGSPDGTAEVVRELAQASDRIHLIERDGKAGLGTAYVAGFGWAMERGYATVVEMDADLSHDPADVPRLLQRARDTDLVVGSRYVPGGRVRNWSALRRVLSRAGNIYARAWLGYDVRDSTSGFRAYRTSALENMDLNTLRSEGYSFQIEMTRRIHRARGSIAEIPITFIEREQGRSKMSRRIVFEAMMRVTAWGLRDRLGRPDLPELRSRPR